MSFPRLSPGSRVGSHSIRKFLGNGPLGERYEVFYGSTNHLHCLTVPPEGVADPGYAEYLRAAAPLFREPCLDHPFAAGEDGGVPWLRSELPPGAPEWALDSPLDPDLLPKGDRSEATSRDGKRRYLLVPTLADLIRAAGPDLSRKDRDQFLGDVFQGLAALHAAGIPCGPLRTSEIDLDRFARTRSAVARIRNWGVVGGDGPLPELFAADLKGAAEFVLVLAAAAGGRPSRTDAALRDFARSLDAGAFPTGVEAREALEKLFRETGSAYARHRDPDAAPVRRFAPPDPEPARPAGPSSGSARRHEAASSRRRGPTGLALVSAGGEVARRTVQFLRGVFLILSIVAFGVGVYFYLRWADERRRLEHAIVSPETYNSVTVVPLSLTEAAGGADASGLDGLFEMPADLLAAEAEAGNGLAAARAALESVLFAAPEDRRAAAGDASLRLAPLLPALAEAGKDDASAAYLHGYALLLGLGAPADPAAAFRELDDAAARGSARAALLLGDWFASDAPLPGGVGEGGRLARDREALARYRAAGGELTAPTPLWRAAADRIAAVLRRATSASDFFDDWGSWLRSSALSGHIPSMAVLGEPGPFSPANPADSLEWLRRVNNYPGALPWVRAWAQVRMAEMFAEGRGVPRSDSSARLWYERAARAGNRTAMLAAAAFFESGRGRNDGRPDPDGAAEWRAKAAEAPPEPSFDPVLLPVSAD